MAVLLILGIAACVTYLIVGWPEQRDAADRVIDQGLALLDEER